MQYRIYATTTTDDEARDVLDTWSEDRETDTPITPTDVDIHATWEHVSIWSIDADGRLVEGIIDDVPGTITDPYATLDVVTSYLVEQTGDTDERDRMNAFLLAVAAPAKE